MKEAHLTALDREILEALATQPRKTWLRPMDVGGRDASPHSPRLARLCRLGLVERRNRNTPWGVRGVYLYRATPEGRRTAKYSTMAGRDKPMSIRVKELKT